jgi:hypothetical protein
MGWRSLIFVGLVLLLIAAGAVAHFRRLGARVEPRQLESHENQTPHPIAAAPKPLLGVRLLETGGFHGAEVKARSGEKWWGLYVTDSGSELLESSIKIKLVSDPIVDDELSATGKEVSVDQPIKPLFLVKNMLGLKPGPVTTIFHIAPLEFYSLTEHPVTSLKLGVQTYQLKLVGRPPELDSILPRDPKLLLTDGVTTQVLYGLEGEMGDADWSLHWAGDLDGDGKLDLYAALNPHYNVSARKLFLSSQAKPGQLVREVAEFVTTGC